MDRRTFFEAAAAGAVAMERVLASSPAAARARAPRRRAKLRAGHQHDHSPEVLRLLAAFGVPAICSALPSRTFDRAWTVDGLTRLREHVESFGIRLEMVPLPMSSTAIRDAENPNIMLGRSPERDREIETICRMLESCHVVGIPVVKYNLTLLGVLGTEPTIGRGGVRQRTFVYEKSRPHQLTEAGRVSEEMMWERITYFLERVVPVAEANRIRIACHPHDPGMPRGTTYRGIARVLGTVEGLEKLVSIQESPYHGLNFCQGTIAEMLEDPREQIHDVIHRFGRRGKIFNVHFRNIRGGLLRFRETFPDDGDMDMIRALRTYRDVGYDGMIMPDHVPAIEGDAGRLRAFSFAFGYIQAAIQAVEGER